MALIIVIHCIACRVVASKTKLLFKKQFIFCLKHVKGRIHTFFIQFAKNWQNREGTIIRRMLRIFFFKGRSNSCGFECSGNMPCWNERFIKYVKGCFKTSTWFYRILTWMLYGPRLLFWLRLFISFSISDSWTGLMKNKFTTLFLKYILKGLFPFGIIDARLEPTLTKKSLNISAIQFLFVITLLFTINEFEVVLSLDFNVTIDLMPSQIFFNIFWMLLKIILTIFFFSIFFSFLEHFYICYALIP